MSNQLQTIDPAALAQVSGGAARSATTTTSGDDQILTALNGILDTIKSLATHQNSGGFNQQELLMLMMIMQQRNQQVAVAAATPYGSWSQEPVIRYY